MSVEPLPDRTSKRDPIEASMAWYLMWFRVFYVGLIVISITLISYFWNKDSFTPLDLFTVSPSFLVFFLSILYFMLSFETIEPGKVGALIFFGKPIKHLGSGLAFRPWLVSRIQTETGNLIQLENQSPPLDKDGKVILVKRQDTHELYFMDDPFQVTFAGPETALYDPVGPVPTISGDRVRPNEITPETDSLLHEQLTGDPHIACQYRIRHMPTFLERPGSIENANRAIMIALRNATQTRLAQHTPDQALQRLRDLDQMLLSTVEILIGEPPDQRQNNAPSATNSVNEKHVDWWGIDVVSVQLTSLGLPRRVNRALASNAAQRARSKKIVNKSVADKTRLENEGDGVAWARRMLHQADADGAKLLAERFKSKSGAEAARLQYATQAVENAENLVMAPPTGLLSVLNIGGQPTQAVTPLTPPKEPAPARPLVQQGAPQDTDVPQKRRNRKKGAGPQQKGP